MPIAHALAAKGYELVFAADGRPLQLLMNEFPQHDFIKLQGYQVRYPKNGNMTGSMLWQSRKIMKGIRAEHNALKNIIKDFKIDGVISDNRFGLHSKEVPCVFITHQLRIQTPYLQNWIQKINFKHIQKFNQCWVPDTKDSALSGLLTKEVNTPFEHRFIGPLSRFTPRDKTDDLEILAIVSGPEPQRSLFERLLRQQLKGKKALLVLGKPEVQIDEQDGDLRIVSHLNGQELNQAMVNAEVVVSRSGYSTLMDLAAVGKRAIFIATPGQTEQLYLAEHFHKNGIAFAMHQKDFDLRIALSKSVNFTGFKQHSNPTNWLDLFTLFEE
jgi:uncharacterized protein (TIGR00661 family)